MRLSKTVFSYSSFVKLNQHSKTLIVDAIQMHNGDILSWTPLTIISDSVRHPPLIKTECTNICLSYYSHMPVMLFWKPNITIDYICVKLLISKDRFFYISNQKLNWYLRKSYFQNWHRYAITNQKELAEFIPKIFQMKTKTRYSMLNSLRSLSKNFKTVIFRKSCRFKDFHILQLFS